jgi:hypothetical protein
MLSLFDAGNLASGVDGMNINQCGDGDPSDYSHEYGHEDGYGDYNQYGDEEGYYDGGGNEKGGRGDGYGHHHGQWYRD